MMTAEQLMREVMGAALARAGGLRQLSRELGLSTSTLSQWQTGSLPSLVKFLQLAEYAGVSPWSPHSSSPVVATTPPPPVMRDGGRLQPVAVHASSRTSSQGHPVPEIGEIADKLRELESRIEARAAALSERWEISISRHLRIDLETGEAFFEDHDGFLGNRRRISSALGIEQLVQVIEPKLWKETRGGLILGRVSPSEGVESVHAFRDVIEPRPMPFRVAVFETSQAPGRFWIRMLVPANYPDFFNIDENGVELEEVEIRDVPIIAEGVIGRHQPMIVASKDLRVVAIRVAEFKQTVETEE